MTNKSQLSSDLQVACEIYHLTQNGGRAWFSKLVETLEGTLDKHQISRAIDTLTDWMIIYGEYGETTKGRASYCYFIDKVAKRKIKELYETYWIDDKNDKN